MNDETSLTRQIIADIDAHLPAWYPGGAPVSAAPPQIRPRKLSFTFRYPLQTAAGERIALHVKIPRGIEALPLPQAIASAPLQEAGRREFAALCRVAEVVAQAADSFLISLKPVGYLPRWNAILTEELPARLLDDLLLDPRLRLGLPRLRQRFGRALFHAGRWLRLYHSGLGGEQSELMRIARITEDISTKISQLNQHLVRQLDLNNLERAFRRVLELRDSSEVPFATQHGDFYCRNVLLTPDDRVCVIDFDPEMNRRAPVYHDLSTFIADLWVQKVKVRSLGFLISHSYLHRCEQTFLQGYFESHLTAESAALLSFFCAKSAFDALYWYGMRKPANAAAQVLQVPMLKFLRHVSREYLDRALGDAP